MDERNLTTAQKLLDLGKAWQPKYERTEIPGLGDVFIKRLSAGERDHFEATSSKQGGQARRSLILIHFCFDDRGSRMFGEDDQATLDMLDPDIVDPIVVQALKFNKFTEAEQDELRKNSNGQLVSSS